VVRYAKRHCVGRSELLEAATPPLAHQSASVEEADEVAAWEYRRWHVSRRAVERARI